MVQSWRTSAFPNRKVWRLFLLETKKDLSRKPERASIDRPRIRLLMMAIAAKEKVMTQWEAIALVIAIKLAAKKGK